MNYQKELDQLLCDLSKKEAPPKLLLHSCCAPCSSYVLEYLSSYFEITVYFYNPNLDCAREFAHRAQEQLRLIREMPVRHPVSGIVVPYCSQDFLEQVKGLEKEPEGGARCAKCFSLRLSKTAEYAAQNGFDFFTTTLTISPLKNAALLNQLGEQAAKAYGVPFLPSDFKKKGGFLRSTQLSAQYGLYRQNYCGCVFSKPTEASDKMK